MTSRSAGISTSSRAWVVHVARFLEPTTESSQKRRVGAMQEILYADDPLWHDSTLKAFDPRTLAWVDRDQASALGRYLSGSEPKPSESVKVAYPSPQRVELDVTLETPGLVILGDVYYPGWELTIDGVPAPIYRANRVMRGAAVPSGRHRLVYTYRPRSFVIGGIISLVGMGIFVLLGVVWTWRPVDRDVVEASMPSQ